MSNLARSERRALMELFIAKGPDAPTLCGDWTTRDLAAHLATRERRPDASLGILLSGLASWTQTVQDGYRAMEYHSLVKLLEAPPWWSPFAIPAVDTLANTAEFFIHHEDVRRAVDGWEARDLPRRDQEDLWSRTAVVGPLLKPARMTVKLVSPGYGRRTVGKGAVAATVTGPPAELLLFCFGRQRVSLAEATGEGAERLRSAQLGI